MEEQKIHCAEASVNGDVLDDECPNKEYGQKASEFIQNTSLDKMLEIAEIARIKKLSEPPKWVFPDEI